MVQRTVIFAVALGMWVGGCGENNPPASSRDATLTGATIPAPTASTGSDSASPSSPATPKTPDFPKIPKDAQFTILCEPITDPNHIVKSKQRKAQLMAATGMSDWYIIHGEDESTLYYGFYRSFNDPNDPKEAARVQSDRQKLNAITDTMGDRPFKACVVVEIDSPDPTAPAQWDLARLRLDEADAEHYWSLQIAAYRESPARKEYAVEVVKAARAQGIEAYFFHGDTTSSVCIGMWPKEAVKEVDRAEAVDRNPNAAPMLVVPPELMPKEGADVRNAEGQKLNPVAPRHIPVDPTLIATMRQFPTHAVNGDDIYREVKGKRVADPSFLIIVPVRKPGSGFSSPDSGGDVAPVAPGVAPAQPDKPRPPAPAKSKLKSLGQ